MKKNEKIQYLNNEKDLPGYPEYPADEDIYSQGSEEPEIDPENISVRKAAALSPEEKSELNEKNFSTDESGGDLDVPGAELDDDLEILGSEDEENNYYSIGGEDHENLEEMNDSGE